VRVADGPTPIELYEKTFKEQDGVLDVDVRLKPTHLWSVCHAACCGATAPRCVRSRRATGTCVDAMVSARRAELPPGQQRLRTPVKRRAELLKVLLIDTSCRATPKENRPVGVRATSFDRT